MSDQHADDATHDVLRTVTVTGRGEVLVIPDTAVLRVGAVRRGAGVSEAWAALTDTVATLTDVAVRHTERRKVSSRGVSLWPAHDHEGRRAGFEARHSYVVATDDLDTAGRLLADLATTVGDHLVVDSVGLEVADDSDARAVARERAFGDARAKAADLAGLAGSALGRVVSVVEGGAGRTEPGVGAMFRVSAEAGGLEAGESAVTADVTVTWELSPARP